MSLATLAELQARMDWILDEGEIREANGALEELSDQAIFHGLPWDPLNVPRLVKNCIIAAARRHMRNPEGYTQSRAGDETLGLVDRGHDAGSAYFTEREVKMIASYAGRGGIVSVPVVAYGTRLKTQTGYVAVDGGKPFPLHGTSYGEPLCGQSTCGTCGPNPYGYL